MESRFFALYQITGWTIVYAAIVLSIYLSQVFTNWEFLYTGVIIGSCALYAYFIRTIYKRWIFDKGLPVQSLYFFIQAMIGASLGTIILISVVLAMSKTGLTFPIAKHQFWSFISFIFWRNVANMFVALIAWSAFYLAIVRARELKDVSQTLATSQLQTLIQQLNPHFLFNMLNNIRALVLEDPERARDALAKLSDMLRYSLRETEFNKVRLAEEVLMVEEYLELCAIQFEDRLNYEFEVASDTRDVLIPRMLLQLCIENAIKHGISKLKQGGKIRVSARIIEKLLVLEIVNPTPERTARVQNLKEENHRGIGLKNIQERIKLLYSHEERSGELGLVFLKNDDNHEAKVTIKLPIEFERKELTT